MSQQQNGNPAQVGGQTTGTNWGAIGRQAYVAPKGRDYASRVFGRTTIVLGKPERAWISEMFEHVAGDRDEQIEFVATYGQSVFTLRNAVKAQKGNEFKLMKLEREIIYGLFRHMEKKHGVRLSNDAEMLKRFMKYAWTDDYATARAKEGGQ